MISLLRCVSLLEFKYSKAPTLFGTHDTDKTFAIIANEADVYKFSWQSEMIHPVIKECNHICLLGVDLDFVILNLETQEVLNKLQFDTFFLDIQFYNDDIYVITQLEVFRINAVDFKLIGSYPLPDIFEGIEITNNQLAIKCFSGEIRIIL